MPVIEPKSKSQERRLGPAVVRDFIPEGETKTAQELGRSERIRSREGRVVHDFIPAKDHQLRAPSGREGQKHEALERAMARQATAAREEFDHAVANLKTMNVAQAVDFITKAPFSVQEMYLAAEAQYGNRKSIIDRFGGVDPAVVEKYRELSKPPVVNETEE